MSNDRVKENARRLADVLFRYSGVPVVNQCMSRHLNYDPGQLMTDMRDLYKYLFDTPEDQIMLQKPCHFCDNARVNPDFNDHNDLHYMTIGRCNDGFGIYLGAGDAKPLRIEFDKWDIREQRYATVGRYYPKNCPECGRRLSEYERKEKGHYS